MQIIRSILFLTLSEQCLAGNPDCGNCNKNSSAYEPVCAVGEQDWLRHTFLSVSNANLTF